MNKELLIKKDLDLGVTWSEIGKKYGVAQGTIKKIKEQGRYYFDMCSGEIVFSSKKVKIKEQQFNYLCYMNDITDGVTLKKQSNSIISQRAINPRLAVYLGVAGSQTHRWSKKEQRLFGCGKDGVADKDLKMFCCDFLTKEEIIFSQRAYYIDNAGMLRGYNLWYVDVSREWLYYLKDYIYTYMDWIEHSKVTDIKEFYEYTKNKFPTDKYCYINTRVAIEYGKWFKKQLTKYNFDYIKNAIELYTKADWYMTGKDCEKLDSLELTIPRTFYLEKGAYYSNLLTSEQKDIVKQYLIK